MFNLVKWDFIFVHSHFLSLALQMHVKHGTKALLLSYSNDGRASLLCRPGQVCQGHLQQRLWYGQLRCDVGGL